MTRPFRFAQSSGVTLIELVVVIAIVGILAALIVQFVTPVRSYIDTSRRAELADAADTALRRIGRDLRLALPNSVRVDPTGKYVEFLLVRIGGRYRYEAGTTNRCGGTPAEDALSFSAADTCFTTMGNLYTIAADITTNVSPTTDYLVVFNMPTGTDKADAYQHQTLGTTPCGSSCNKSQISSATNFGGEDQIQFASNTFTYESPGRRFFIIEGAVTYGCTGTGLIRYSGYGVNPTQVAPPTGGTSATLASGVSSCSFTYDNAVSTSSQGAGLVTMALQLQAQVSGGSSETVSLYNSVHVNNVP